MQETTRNGMKFCTRFLVLLFLFLPCMMQAQQASVSAKLDGAQIVIGDRAKLFIEAQQPQGTRLEWASLPDTFNSLEIVEKGKIDTIPQNGFTLYKQRLLLTGFDSGAFVIPAFTFSAIPQTGNAYTLQTDSFLLTVSTVPVDTSQPFKPIKGIMNVQSDWRDYLPYMLLGAAILALIAGIIIYLKKRKKKMPVAPPLPAISLQQKTLLELDALEAKQLWQKGKVKEYYISLTDILRDYLEARFRIHAMEQTTDELLSQTARHNQLRKYHDALATILRTADLAKFAKAQPTQPEHIQTLEATRDFVKNTPLPTSETLQQ